MEDDVVWNECRCSFVLHFYHLPLSVRLEEQDKKQNINQRVRA